jgi:hypothetical protein
LAKQRFTGKRSAEFALAGREPKRYVVVSPARLWIRVQAKAKGKISLRALILGLLSRWLEGDIVHPLTAEPCRCQNPDFTCEGVCRSCGGYVQRTLDT